MHTTTPLYNPEKTAKGNMVELLPKWKKRGWRTFYGGGGGTTPAAAMQCPHCSGRLAPSGKLRIKPAPVPELTQAQKNQAIIDESFKLEPEPQAQDVQQKIRAQDTIFTCESCGRQIRGIVGFKSHEKACKVANNG